MDAPHAERGRPKSSSFGGGESGPVPDSPSPESPGWTFGTIRHARGEWMHRTPNEGDLSRPRSAEASPDLCRTRRVSKVQDGLSGPSDMHAVNGCTARRTRAT